MATPVPQSFDGLKHGAQGGLTYLLASVEYPRDRADTYPGVRGHIGDGDPVDHGPGPRRRRGRRHGGQQISPRLRSSGTERFSLEAFPRQAKRIGTPRGRIVKSPVHAMFRAGTFTQPQPGRHHLARLVIGAVVDLPQRPGHHPPGDIVDRDGHAGQPRVHHAGRDAAVEAGDGEVLADPQPQFGGHAVDDRGEPVAAGHDGVRADTGTTGAEQRPDLPAGAGVVHEQHVRLVGGDPAGGQPVLEPGGPLGIPVIRRPVTQEGDAAEPPGQHVLHGRRWPPGCRCRPSSAAAPDWSGRNRRRACPASASSTTRGSSCCSSESRKASTLRLAIRRRISSRGSPSGTTITML